MLLDRLFINRMFGRYFGDFGALRGGHRRLHYQGSAKLPAVMVLRAPRRIEPYRMMPRRQTFPPTKRPQTKRISIGTNKNGDGATGWLLQGLSYPSALTTEITAKNKP
jgi:hypothetical protein